LTELVEEAAAKPVLAAFSACKGEEFGLDAVTAGFESEHATVFIIWVGDDLHESRSGAEFANLELQTVDA
jgi:hypothetical protein